VKAKDIYGYESNWSEPLWIHIMIISLTNIRGGLGIHAQINNLGKRRVWGIVWDFTITGGRVQYPAQDHFEGSITNIAKGDSLAISSGAFFQIGRIHIKITLHDNDGRNAMETTVNAFAFGFIVFVSQM
jgi:hypothetical protein